MTRMNVKLFAIDVPVKIKVLFPSRKLSPVVPAVAQHVETVQAGSSAVPVVPAPPGQADDAQSRWPGGSPLLLAPAPAPRALLVLLQLSNEGVWALKCLRPWGRNPLLNARDAASP